MARHLSRVALAKRDQLSYRPSAQIIAYFLPIRKLLRTTETEEKAIAPAAITGERIPEIARGMAITL